MKRGRSRSRRNDFKVSPFSIHLCSVNPLRREQFFLSHHIVAFFAEKALVSRDILQKFDIPINSADNGAWSPGFNAEDAGPGAYHPGLNTGKYHEEVNERLFDVIGLERATGREKCLEVLKQIKNELSENTFPYQK